MKTEVRKKNPVLSQNVRKNETFAVNETSKEKEICNFGSESGNYHYTGILTGNVRNIDIKTVVYSEDEVVKAKNVLAEPF